MVFFVVVIVVSMILIFTNETGETTKAETGVYCSIKALQSTHYIIPELTCVVNCDKTFPLHKGCCASNVVYAPTVLDLY